MKAQDDYKVTAIGVIPAGWDISRIGQISSLVTKGSTPTTYGFNFEKEGINFIKIESLDDNTGKIKKDMLSKIGNDCHTAFSRSQLKEGDILFAIAGAIGKCLIVPKEILPANTNQALAIIRLLKEINTRYVYYQLKGNLIQNKIDLIKTTTAQANISLEQVSGFEIPLPPPAEQQKIADILSTVDEHISETEDLIAHTKTLKQGMMQRLLTKGIGHTEFKDTEIGRIPRTWGVVPLRTFAQVVTGKTPPTTQAAFWGESIPWVTPSDIDVRRDIFSSERSLSDAGYTTTPAKLPPNTVLVTCIASIGKNAICRVKASCNQQINAILPNNKYSPEYLYYWISYNANYYKKHAAKTAVSILKKSIFENLPIPFPILKEQQEIASILSAIDDQIDAFQSKLDALNRLKSGLMQQLLTGRIRVKV